jgi:hypothetical protein
MAAAQSIGEQAENPNARALSALLTDREKKCLAGLRNGSRPRQY